MSIRFKETDGRSLGRASRGVKAITFKKANDEVVGFDIITDESTVLTVSETGYGRRSKGEDYKVQKRGGSGLLNYRVDKYGDVAAIRVVNDEDDLIMISSSGIIIRIRVEDINLVSRPAKGVKVMRITGDDKLITLATATHEDETEEPEIAETTENSASAEETAAPTEE